MKNKRFGHSKSELGLGSIIPALSYADDLSYLEGFVKEPDANITAQESNHSTIWQVDYRHYFNKNLAASVSYINEGHITDRKRDGVAPQFWVNLPLFNNHLAFALGGGLYRYYDTVGSLETSSADEHGWGQIYSASMTYNASLPIFLRITVNKTIAPHSTNSILFGAGIRLWDTSSEVNKHLIFYRPLNNDKNKNEVTAFFGRTSHNSFADLKGESFGVEYRRRVFKYLDWTATWLYQNDPGALKRNGIGTQIWAIHDYLDRHLTLGVGVGPYYFHDYEHDTEYHSSFSNNMGELVSGMVLYRFTDHWSAKFIWNRVGTKYNHDTDDYLLGIGYSW